MAVGNEKIITNYVYNGLNSFGMVYSDEIIGTSVTVNDVDSAFTITNTKRIVLDINPNIGDKVKVTIEYVYNTADLFMTAEEILALLKTVDGVGSGLDADLLQGINGDQYLKINDDIVVNSVITELVTLPNGANSLQIKNDATNVILNIDKNGLLTVNEVITNKIKPIADILEIELETTDTFDITNNGTSSLTVGQNETTTKNVEPKTTDIYNIGSLSKIFNQVFTNVVRSINDIIFNIPSLKSFIFKNNGVEVAKINENGLSVDNINALVDSNLEFGNNIVTKAIEPSIDNTYDIGKDDKRIKIIYTNNIKLGSNDLQTYIDNQDTNVLSSSKSYTDNLLINYYNKTETDNLFLGYYNKTETDNLLTNIDLTAVKTDIKPFNDNVSIIGSITKFFKELYVRSITTDSIILDGINVGDKLKERNKLFTLIDINRDSQTNNTRKIFNLIKGGTSSNNVVQNIAVDEINNYIFTLHVGGSNPEYSVINRYKFNKQGDNTFIDVSNSTTDIGHQGLTVQYLENGNTKMWASAPYGSGNGSNIIRFDYVGNSNILNLETFKLFESNTSSQSASPTISYCGKYMIVEQNSTQNSVTGNTIRVFELEKLTTPGDYSNDFLYEFFVSVTNGSGNDALQSMVSDGTHIYILSGDNDINNDKTLAVFTINGDLVTENRKLEVGKSDAANEGAGTFYETEGMEIATINGVPRILLQNAIGDQGARKCPVYVLGDNFIDIRNNTLGPSYLSRNGNLDYGVPSGESIQFGTYDITNNSYDANMLSTPDGGLIIGEVYGAGAAYSGIVKPASVNKTSFRILDNNKDNTNHIMQISTKRTSNTSQSFLKMYSGGSGNSHYGDSEFNFTLFGDAYADGSWNSGGADYAEYFEWEDGNINKEDRRGFTVSIIPGSSKIKIAEEGDIIIGAISSNPSIVGNSAWNSYNNKYKKDKYKSNLLDKDGNKILNESYIEDKEYKPRSERQEWELVGLLGKVVINKNQLVKDNWIKLEDTSDDTTEYLIK